MDNQIFNPLTGKPLSWGRVEIALGEGYNHSYELNKEGRPSTSIETPSNCRMIYKNSKGECVLDGRFRRTKFVLAGVFRKKFGEKEITF